VILVLKGDEYVIDENTPFFMAGYSHFGTGRRITDEGFDRGWCRRDWKIFDKRFFQSWS
jgi:hypothetical protein